MRKFKIVEDIDFTGDYDHYARYTLYRRGPWWKIFSWEYVHRFWGSQSLEKARSAMKFLEAARTMYD